ncbi:MAG: 4-(cytidine 5'-diphospho)-2-C-methyl-D-erythritol kinase, partial [Bacteroidota bacterium]
YKALDYTQFDPNRDLMAILSSPIEEWKDTLDNDLEVPVFEMYPELSAIKAQLYAEGALYAAMSGSGSCMFGIFAS